jgi:hypothetical protein
LSSCQIREAAPLHGHWQTPTAGSSLLRLEPVDAGFVDFSVFQLMVTPFAVTFWTMAASENGLASLANTLAASTFAAASTTGPEPEQK